MVQDKVSFFSNKIEPKRMEKKKKRERRNESTLNRVTADFFMNFFVSDACGSYPKMFLNVDALGPTVKCLLL